MKYKKLKISENEAGFSLLEMIVAVAIFSLVIMVAVSTFVSVINVRKKTREIQQNMENARVAMDGITKILRNSDVVSSTQSKVRIYDYSQERCAEYEFISATKSLKYSYNTVPLASKDADCTAGASLTAVPNMLSGTVSSGKFNVSPSTDILVGRATIMMQIQNAGGTDKALLQTTVSLRSLSQEVNPS
jgi:prepilin-type N-terminal cleavage/methylation domain-containing protein